MSWSYSDALSTDVDKVRALIGDIDTNDQQFSNEGITARITAQGSVGAAAIKCCQELIAKYARQVDTSNVKISVGASKRAEAYRTLLADLRAQFGAPEWRVGGVLRSERDDREADDTLIQPSFTRGMDANPGSATSADSDIYEDRTC